MLAGVAPTVSIHIICCQQVSCGSFQHARSFQRLHRRRHVALPAQRRPAARHPPRSPPDATLAWHETRITRLIEEIVAPNPADAGQARIAVQILIVRELLT